MMNIGKYISKQRKKSDPNSQFFNRRPQMWVMALPLVKLVLSMYT